MLKYRISIDFELDNERLTESECDELVDDIYGSLHKEATIYKYLLESINTELKLLEIVGSGTFEIKA